MMTICNILDLCKSAFIAKNLELGIVLSNFTLYLVSPGICANGYYMPLMCSQLQPFSCSELTQELFDNWCITSLNVS